MYYQFYWKHFVLNIFVLLLPISTVAQIVPDDTLNNDNSEVNSLNEFSERIEGGAIRGNNLFHSFDKFNIKAGTEAYFANPAGIENIFSRVTGSNMSKIFGTLGVDGTANLFLLNPNGIVFGKNAAIDIGGSFIATTAETIEFSDGTRFNATSTSKLSLLTSEIPIGLGFGSTPGAIQVNGKGHNLILNTAERTFRLPPSSSLNVSFGNTIALIGGDINFDGGVVVAEDGHIELGSVAAGKVNFDIADLVDFRYAVSQLRDITFTNLALADASGLLGGSISVVGNDISFRLGSGLFVQNIERKTGDSIKVSANSLNILKGEYIPTLLFSERGYVELTSGSQVVRGGILDGVSVPPNQSLNQVLKTFGLSVDKGEFVNGFVPSFIFSESLLNGRGKNINISTRELLISGGSQLITRSFDTAIAGSINVNSAGTTKIQEASNTPGFSEQNFEIFSQINSTTFGSGKGGNIKLVTNNLLTSDGGSINSTSNNIGKGGNININANTINLIGSVPNVFLPSSIAAGTADRGNAGNLIINAKNIFLRDGAAITTSTLASGNAGEIKINAIDSIEITGIDSNSKLPSAITSGGGLLPPELREAFFLPPFPTGDAGNLSISAKNIRVSSGGQINVTNLGTGNAGELSINASDTVLNNAGEIAASTTSGQGGNIALNSDRLSLLDNSQISATAGGTGDGGNINISADTILGLNNSDITANAFKGNGGNITITADSIVGLEARPSLTLESDITADSELGIDGTVTINSPESNAEEDVVVAAREIDFEPYRELFEGSCFDSNRPRRQELVYIGGGVPESPYNFFDEPEPFPMADTPAKKPQNSEPRSNVPPVWQEGDPLIEPNAVQTNPDGRTFLVAIEEREIKEPLVCTKNAEELK